MDSPNPCAENTAQLAGGVGKSSHVQGVQAGRAHADSVSFDVQRYGTSGVANNDRMGGGP